MAKHNRKTHSSRARRKLERLQQQIETTCIEDAESPHVEIVDQEIELPGNDGTLGQSLDGTWGGGCSNGNGGSILDLVNDIRVLRNNPSEGASRGGGGLVSGHSRASKTAPAPRIPKPPTQRPAVTAEETIPRGLQIPALSTIRLTHGFRYPKELNECGIPQGDWEVFCGSIVLPLINRETPGVAWAIEQILDRVAMWDAQCFRPRGFIIRMDMPGEQKYGLDFMDIHHFYSLRKHVDNLSDKPPVVGIGNHW
ncbi:uncharacterized protein LY89DRAFT_341660 [Mollisia scopiformis]|uniref:Uncharacterized protein n=1 Tax=Mollisia scopiformis TaxID=149040 RepID=A0A132B7H4_MOLSC|nr:uncharacterized protein LY89DRAFT_341660 [Mollisia scopiformis]KUJ08355.1 hypothetical protein LY89DRAFT_341660 [Mollisia scopiformis]